MKLLRNVLAVLLGLVIGSVANMAVVMLGPMLIAPPVGFDGQDAQAMARTIHLLEPHHFVTPFLAHALGTLVGAVVAFVIAASHKERLAWLIGAVFLCGGIAASVMIPAPAWFIALDLVAAYLPMAWLGGRVGARVAPSA